MKIVKLFGGLGNQMFQYAFGKRIGADAYDVSWFESDNPNMTPRDYELNLFNCAPKLLTRKQSKKIIKNNKILKLIAYFTFGWLCGWQRTKTINEEPVNIYDGNLFNYNSGFFVGYFQCAKYYNSVRSQLLKDFVPKFGPNIKNKRILNLIHSTNSVSVHIRRGDYVKLQHIHGLCDIDYYQKAIDLICAKVENPYFFVFSDDIDWVKNNRF